VIAFTCIRPPPPLAAPQHSLRYRPRIGGGFAPIDPGCKLETAVFLHWRRQREDLAYLSADREIDLVVNGERPEALINVALSVSHPAAWEREIAALEWASAKAPRASRVLVVHEDAARRPPAGIKIVEAWRYLLGLE
jgi:predicted AAA+ superfamily ATPase